VQFYIIRHGQSANNLLWEQTGQDQGRVEDPELTENGRQQAKTVAQFLAQHQQSQATGQGIDDFTITHLYSSLMVRSMDTANTIAGAIGLRPKVWADFHETGGIWLKDEETGEPIGQPGNNRAFFADRYPNFELPDDLDEAGWWNRPFEGLEGFAARAKTAIKALHERHGGTDDRVAIVSHGGFYNCLMLTLLNLPITEPPPIWFTLNNTGITRVDFFEERVRIAYTNRVDFLPRALVT